MKKNNAKPANNAPEKEAPARLTLKWLEVSAILASKVETENKMEFDLVERQKGEPTVTLTIYPSDKDFDNAILNVFGFSIRVVVRAGKSGMFVSFPSQKGKDGNYYDQVTCYDKNFHSTIKAALSAIYADSNE